MAEDKDKDKNGKKPPIIVKRFKKAAGGHHGGAWKVAYADFVTAMMAFFLLLWLLSSAPQETLVGIADYFQPTVGVKDSEGIGFDGGTGATDGTAKSDSSPPSQAIVFGAPSTGPLVKDPDQEMQDEEAERVRLLKIENDIKKNITTAEDLKEFKDNIIIDMTPEGLRIQIVDSQNRPMFKPGSAEMEEVYKKILTGITRFIAPVPNYISITGHTDSTWGDKKDYNNWEISSDRANVSRRFILNKGYAQEKVAWVVGKADREPLKPESPQDPTNRRVSIILLKRNVLPKHLQTAPDKVFMENQSGNDDSMLKLNNAPLDKTITTEPSQ